MTKSSRRPWSWLLGILAFLGLVFVLGPRTSTTLPPIVPVSVPNHPNTLTQWLAQREGAAGQLRSDTQAHIVWADPLHPARADCAMVYLHGFTASQGKVLPFMLSWLEHLDVICICLGSQGTACRRWMHSVVLMPYNCVRLLLKPLPWPVCWASAL